MQVKLLDIIFIRKFENNSIFLKKLLLRLRFKNHSQRNWVAH